MPRACLFIAPTPAPGLVDIKKGASLIAQEGRALSGRLIDFLPLKSELQDPGLSRRSPPRGSRRQLLDQDRGKLLDQDGEGRDGPPGRRHDRMGWHSSLDPL